MAPKSITTNFQISIVFTFKFYFCGSIKEAKNDIPFFSCKWNLSIFCIAIFILPNVSAEIAKKLIKKGKDVEKVILQQAAFNWKISYARA